MTEHICVICGHLAPLNSEVAICLRCDDALWNDTRDGEGRLATYYRLRHEAVTASPSAGEEAGQWRTGESK